MLGSVEGPVEYAGSEVVAPLCEAATASWSDRATLHPGTVSWSASPHHGSLADWRAAVWHDAFGLPVAAAWLAGPSRATILATSAHPHRDKLLQHAATWAADHGDRALTSDVLDTDRAVVAAWKREGLRASEDAVFWRRDTHGLVAIGDPAPPPGHLVRPVATTVVDRDARVELHVAAWSTSDHPSGFDATSYARLRRSPSYRPELDIVVEGPRGRLLASALVWWDQETKVGLVEPVGVRPDARGHGLGRVAVLGALWALRAEGGGEAVVWPRGDAAYDGPARLFAACGFTAGPRTVTMRRR
jgi:GNAT superfamily N-acetyltransferase